jgi:pilus assembly protein CpaF
MDFQELCALVAQEMEENWIGSALTGDPVNLQKRAIIGYREESSLLKNRVAEIIEARGMADFQPVPPWYESLTDAVFHEVWGLAGMAEWFGETYADSGSAKIIGGRIYYMKDGAMKLMPQRIDEGRLEQLVRALLLLSPEERLDNDSHEVYMLDGTRVTIFRGGMVKKGQLSVIFRRYIVPIYSFEQQAGRGTIPREAIPLFEDMVRLGYNVVICGSVRSAKTTFLATWQSYEDQELEGVMVETDPEIPLHKLMPDAPIVQIIADGERLAGISKNLMRSDADYFILAEARDGFALDTALRIARKGTRRMKMTYHCRDPRRLAQDAAAEIVRCLGGDPEETALRIADSFDYVFHFGNIRPGNIKRLRGIYELGVDENAKTGRRAIRVRELCRYIQSTDEWRWRFQISEDKEEAGRAASETTFTAFELKLRALEEGSC